MPKAAANEFAPNINVVDEMFAGTLAEYVALSLKTMQKVFTNINVLSREDFQTQDHEAGVKIVTENRQQDRMLRQTFFFLGPGKRKYVITCSALASNGALFDKSFATSAETFRLH